MWNSLKQSFNLPLPNVAITCGWPSRRSRGRFSNRAPGEIIVDEWKGSNIEKAFVSIHPERFEEVEQVALSVLYVVGNEVYGSRRNSGALTLGVNLNRENGMLEYTADDKGKHAKTVLHNITKQLGDIPPGFADLPEPKATQKTRQRKYACSTCGQIIRAASDTLQVLCLHAGTPHLGENASPFAIQVPKVKATTTDMASRRAAPAVPVATPPAPTEGTMGAENVKNIAKAIAAGAAKVSHGRMFGAETA